MLSDVTFNKVEFKTKNMTPTDQLETFRLNYPSIRCMVYDDSMVYKCGHGTADSSVRVANTYIRELKLNLKARKTSETSFVIKEK